ncbi:MAG: hypothetical protein KF789_11510, partial [Bdellovibrionaceae bacterium]|nr:hypothetical protein [Pseudobdellovibrionaceae bacterium]MBX3041323.1 hypothetical protein [Pseudobdellovibrionaceae bacterium]
MRLHLIHLGLLASLLSTSPALASSFLCSQVFSDKVSDVKINDLLGRGEASKITENFKLQLSTLFQTIENYYGPLELKASTVSLNWRQFKADTLKKAGQLKNTNEQYYFIAEVLARMNDGHVSSVLPSSLVYRLPVQLVSAEGKYYSNAVFQAYPAGLRIPKKGDEVVAINGLTPAEFQKQHAVWNASGNSQTNQSMFGMTFGFWSEAGGLPLSKITQDGVTMKFKSHETGEIYDVALPFRKQGIGLIGKELGKPAPAPDIVSGSLAGRNDRSTELQDMPKTSSIFSGFHQLLRAQKPAPHMTNDPVKVSPENSPMRLGEVTPFFKLPESFKPITLPEAMTKEPVLSRLIPEGELMAGTFSHQGKTVGFLRVPSYSPKELAPTIRKLRYLIAELERTTDYLVIDQTNNPGGMVIYSDMLVKSLTGKLDEASHMRFSVKPTQKFLRQYADLRNQIARNEDGAFTAAELEVFLPRVDREYKKILAAFESGKSLSDPVSMLVMSEIFEKAYMRELGQKLPNGMTIGDLMKGLLGVDIAQNQVYTKKIYMMINELDFSGGDATPAILQDYGRARLIGTRTAGAGGTVENFSFRGQQELRVNLTTSLMVRKDGRLVENYGVHPDLPLPLKGSDVADGYSTYFSRVLE